MASSDYKKFNREIKGYVELQSKVKQRYICNFDVCAQRNSSIN